MDRHADTPNSEADPLEVALRNIKARQEIQRTQASYDANAGGIDEESLGRLTAEERAFVERFRGDAAHQSRVMKVLLKRHE